MGRRFLGNRVNGAVLLMELLVVLHGLQVAWNKGCRRLVCYSDSLLTVTLVNHPPPGSHQCAGVIACIRDFLHRDWLVRLQHTLREGNACTDFLAKTGAR